MCGSEHTFMRTLHVSGSVQQCDQAAVSAQNLKQNPQSIGPIRASTTCSLLCVEETLLLLVFFETNFSATPCPSYTHYSYHDAQSAAFLLSPLHYPVRRILPSNTPIFNHWCGAVLRNCSACEDEAECCGAEAPGYNLAVCAYAEAGYAEGGYCTSCPCMFPPIATPVPATGAYCWWVYWG